MFLFVYFFCLSCQVFSNFLKRKHINDRDLEGVCNMSHERVRIGTDY